MFRLLCYVSITYVGMLVVIRGRLGVHQLTHSRIPDLMSRVRRTIELTYVIVDGTHGGF